MSNHYQQELRTSEFRIRRRAVTSPNKKVRIIVMGSPSVGKTSIINQYMRQKIMEEYASTLSTLGQEEEESGLKLEILDTDGLLVPSMRKLAIRTAHAFVLVYAVDDEESFEYITDLRDDIIRMKGESVPMVVVGNKIDSDRRQVHPVLADCVVSIDWECEHVEVSATDGFEVDGLFNQLLNHPDLERQIAASSPNYRKYSLPTNTNSIIHNQIDTPAQRKVPLWNIFKRVFVS